MYKTMGFNITDNKKSNSELLERLDSIMLQHEEKILEEKEIKEQKESKTKHKKFLRE